MINRFVFSGTGGQGIITAAIILAEAALHFEGLHAVQTQSYGAEARGGAARADVIISSEPVKFPKVTEPNVLICLSQVSFDKYSWIVRPGGFVLVDPHFVHRRQGLNSRCVEIPLHDSIIAEQGSARNLNLCMLGTLTALIDFVHVESVLEVVRGRFTEPDIDKAIQAVLLGRSLVHETVEVF